VSDSPETVSKVVASLRSHLQELVASLGIIILAVMVFISLHHGPYATASDSGPLAANVVRAATDMNWRQSPSSVLISAGRNSVTLSACPPGVLSGEPHYYVYIAGTGTPEAVEVTGGTCRGDGRPGSLEFTTVHSHSSGYTIGSASGGIQEASIAARFTPTNPTGVSQAGKVIIPPGEYDVFATISIRASGQTIDFQSAILNCYTSNDACIFVGGPESSNEFQDITLNSPRARPMTVGGTNPFIEVNGQKTRIFNVATRRAFNGGSFGAYVQVDDDQAFLLDGLNSILGAEGITCNPTFCGAFVSAPGPFNRWSAVGWLKHLNLSLQCAGKGVDWVSGNGLKISDSVIQGWSVFGVRVSNQRGGYGGFISDNVYYEASNCKDASPYGNVGNSAIIAEGVHVKISGLANNGASGVFPNWGANSGSHDWLYWVVPVHANFGDGIPLPAGYALTDGSGSITGTFPKIAGASSYKILKIDWDQKTAPRPFPEGTGNYLVTTIQQTACATLVCKFTDNSGTLTSYTNVAENLSRNFYMPRLDFWPGAIVISSKADMSTATYHDPSAQLQSDVLGIGAIVSTIPPGALTGEAHSLIATGATPPAVANLEALNTSGSEPPGATLMRGANLPVTAEDGHKGRLNFGYGGRAEGFTPLITLGDSNWGKTWATGNHRPGVDVNDLDLGYEGSIDTFYSRAQREIRAYIGKLPDRDPQEKLSASAKTFNVPVTINGDLTVTGKCAGCSGAPNAGVATARDAVSLAGQTAAIGGAILCPSTACGAGQYRIAYYLGSAGACASPGNAAASLTISWKDETATRTMKVPLTGLGTSSAGLSLGSTSNFANGEISIWSAGDAAITYSTSYKGCTAGAAKYSLRIAAEKVQ